MGVESGLTKKKVVQMRESLVDEFLKNIEKCSVVVGKEDKWVWKDKCINKLEYTKILDLRMIRKDPL